MKIEVKMGYIKHCIPLFVLIFSAGCSIVVGNYAVHRYYSYQANPLPDVFHESPIELDQRILDVIVVANNLIISVLLIRRSYLRNTMKYIDRAFLTTGIVYLLRSLCIYVTYMPVPRGCSVRAGLPLWTIRMDYCGDLMFSGHTSQFTVGILFLQEMYPYKSMRVLCLLSCLFYGYIIAISKAHYTIDVIIAMCLATFVYQNVRWYPLL